MIQLPFFSSPVKWKPPHLPDLPAWPTHGRVGLDCETRDPLLTKLGPGVRRGGYIVGVSFAWERDAWYLPVRHEAGGNMEPASVLPYLKDQAASFRGEIVGANLQYDLDYLAEWGVKFHPSVRFLDVQLAAPLIYELHISYSLDSIASRLGLPLKDESELLEVGRLWGLGKDIKAIKRQLWKLPSSAVGAYAEYDAILPLRVLELQEKEIVIQGLEEVWALETDNLPVALSMRRRGVLIDQPKLQHISDWAEEVEREELEKVRAVTGVPVMFGDTQKAALLSEALKQIGLICPETETGKPSVTAEFLLDHPHVVTCAILRAKQFAKLRTTFCRQVWDRLCKGRVHCTFNQMRTQKPGSDDLSGAAFGRYSSSDFNIQNQPIRNKEFGKLWRSIYIPDPGMMWASSDFSAQEPRLAVHFATLMKYPGAAASAQSYWEDPHADPHTLTAATMFPEQWKDLKPYYEKGHGSRYEEAKILREKSKTLFLSYCYGKGKGKISLELGYSTVPASFTSPKTREVIHYQAPCPAGQKVLDRFAEKVPFIPMLAKETTRRAEIRGYVMTLSGRRCRFRKGANEYEDLHKAANRVIQGSAGDQMKMSMRDLRKAGIKIQMSVHDEIDWSTDSLEEIRAVGQIMINAVKLKVPAKVDLEWGKSWGELTNTVDL